MSDGSDGSRSDGSDSDGSDEEEKTESRAVDRLTLFSDAVVAIAITLLALDLPVPEGDSVSAFWSSVRENDGHYAAFLISFVVIAAAWGNHHDVFRYLRRTSPRLRTFNMAWLMTIVLNPFATRLLTSAGNPVLDVHAVRFGFYALLQVAESGVFLSMMRHMIARGLAPGLPQPVVTSLTRQSYVLMAAFGVSIPIFFVTTYGWLLWLAGPLAEGQLKRLRRLRRERPRR